MARTFTAAGRPSLRVCVTTAIFRAISERTVLSPTHQSGSPNRKAAPGALGNRARFVCDRCPGTSRVVRSKLAAVRHLTERESPYQIFAAQHVGLLENPLGCDRR